MTNCHELKLISSDGKKYLTDCANNEESLWTKGYPQDWIDKRLRGIAVRQNLTDRMSRARNFEWKKLCNFNCGNF